MVDEDKYQAFIDFAFDNCRTTWGTPGVFRVRCPLGGGTVTIQEISMGEFLDTTAEDLGTTTGDWDGR